MVVPTAATAADHIRNLLANHRVAWRDEIDLQDEIADVLHGHGIGYEREVRLGAAGRIDFVASRLGIEVKVQGSASDVERQLARYAASGMFDALMLVTTRRTHFGMPARVADVPLIVVPMLGGAW